MVIDTSCFVDRTVFLVGNAKHAGKTTFLNHALRLLRGGSHSVAYLSIGVDGEGRDLISGIPKPDVQAEAGDWLVTGGQAAGEAEAGLRVCDELPFPTVLGPTLLAEVTRAGRVELVGPENNAQLAAIIGRLWQSALPDCVLVDGAFDRMTQLASVGHAAYVRIVRAEPATVGRAVRALRLQQTLESIPCANAAELQDGVEYSRALTPARLADLPEDDRPLIIHDLTRVFLEQRDLEQLCHSRPVRFRDAPDCLYVVTNLFDVPRDAFLDALGTHRFGKRLMVETCA